MAERFQTRGSGYHAVIPAFGQGTFSVRATQPQHVPPRQTARIAAEGAPNVEQIVIADLDLSKLVDNGLSGTPIPLPDKRIDVYENAVEVLSAI